VLPAAWARGTAGRRTQLAGHHYRRTSRQPGIEQRYASRGHCVVLVVCSGAPPGPVRPVCGTRSVAVTQIDIDQDALDRTMALSNARTKKEVVSLALRCYADRQERAARIGRHFERARRWGGGRGRGTRAPGREGSPVIYLLDTSALVELLRDPKLQQGWYDAIDAEAIGSCYPQRAESNPQGQLGRQVPTVRPGGRGTRPRHRPRRRRAGRRSAAARRPGALRTQLAAVPSRRR
jgi:Arc/MetJ family transcription regulator